VASGLIVLPLAAFAALWATRLGMTAREGIPSWRQAFLEASVLWGVFVAVGSEGLGLVHALERGWLAVYWGVVTGGTAWVAIRCGLLREAQGYLADWRPSVSKLDWVLLAGIGCVVGALLVVAWVSPPNNVDSLLYHMSRVVHWAQNRSLQHYASGYVNQIVMPIWAETAILNLRILWGTDQPANLIQWFSMVGSLVAVSAVAARLGARIRGQLIAAASVVAIPMGILQATSTQNDYVTAFWLVSLLYWVIAGIQHEPRAPANACMGLTVGLGALTKGTYFVYALPLLAWFFLAQARAAGLRKAVSTLLLIAALTGVLNLGYWSRNWKTFGGPLGAPGLVGNYLNLGGAPSSVPSALGDVVGNPGGAIKMAAFRVARAELQMIGWNLTTPLHSANRLIESVLAAIPSVFDQGYLEAHALAIWNHEDTAGNPIPLVLVAVTLLILVANGFAGTGRLPLAYAAGCLAGYLLLPQLLSNGTSLIGVRFQLPFFVAWAPIVGVVFGGTGERRGPWNLGLFLVLCGIPWLLFNNTRPLIGRMPWTTRTPSVLTAESATLLFAMNPGVQDEYDAIARSVRLMGCSQVGLRLDSHDLEYLFWRVLHAPESGVRIETVYTYPELVRYLDPTFRPCAVICTICDGRTRLYGLPLAQDFGTVTLFAGQGFLPNPDA